MKITRTPTEQGKALRVAVDALNHAQGRVGWFPSAKYENGAPVAGVMAVQEYGSAAKGIPPRPVMRLTVAAKQNEWAQTSKQIAKAVVNGHMAPNALMPALTMKAEGDLRETITQITEPALAPATIAARKRRLANGGKGAAASIGKPLVDTGIALNTVSSEVS